MKKKELTIEALRGICDSSFELAHYAIQLGRYYMKAGREIHIDDIIKEIKKHPDPSYLEELRKLEEIEEETEGAGTDG